MPTIEFHGFPADDVERLKNEVSQLVTTTGFAGNIVLSQGFGSLVTDLDDNSRPFFRILTRSRDRAAVLRGRLGHLADVEIVYIEFHERSA